MKKAELTKLRVKTSQELEKVVIEKKAKAAGSKQTRRDIAQILTIIGEKKLNENTNR